MNPLLSKLQPYPFERLAKLKANAPYLGDKSHIALSIGEPKHPAPTVAMDAIQKSFDELTQYPATRGLPELREAISDWIERRFNTKVCADTEILPCNGTREALFSIAQALVAPESLIATPNPFYQIYEGAAYLSGATPLYISARDASSNTPDYDSIDGDTWDQVELLYLCSPDNPSGHRHTLQDFKKLFALADKHHFVIVSDECYSELYRDGTEAPLGVLDACRQLDRSQFTNVVTVHSLSKRSNLPGLRSGFIAGDRAVIDAFFKYRTYHGCAMGLPAQRGSIAAWSDEQHVETNRRLYDEKYRYVEQTLTSDLLTGIPDAGFYLWLNIGSDDLAYAQSLFEQQNVTVLPGQFLARTVNGSNPGEGFVRIALVANLDECKEAIHRINQHWKTYNAKA